MVQFDTFFKAVLTKHILLPITFIVVVPNIHPKPKRKWEQFPPKSRMRKTLFLIRILPVVSSHCSRQETAVNCSYITLPRPGLWWSSPIQPWTWLLLFWYTYYRSRSPALTFGWILSINIFAVLSLYINEWNGNFYYLFNLTLHDFTKNVYLYSKQC